MRRCVVVSCRVGKDQKTNDDLLYLTMYRLPNIMSNGGLWYSKKEEAVISTCINKKHRPEDFEKFKNILPCTLVDVTFGINDFNNKAFVEKLEIVPGTENIFDVDILYVK